ncbi:family 78 glycoside hydrolase catalytic domain [Natrinema amylolyticum]|uniref:family 78 glycoside hydrolase catalytic domain n=1 Tax=Natrinema amylolyticum TaxID=2878679 RepID=UPI001CF9C19A|nr:family 78 glycoside hydrolase catalytic domain [Natrinema amylolyticum]
MTTYVRDRHPTRPVTLRVDYEPAPSTVAPETPDFSWRVASPDRGARQTAYRILVARSEAALEDGRGDCWDSGKVAVPDSTCVPYDGVPLESATDYYWTVRVWDETDEPSEWAEPARFSTTLAGESEWEGEWIGYRPDGGDSNGYRSHWHPADADVAEWVQVDLGDVRRFERIELHPADPFDGPTTPDGTAVSERYSHEAESDAVTNGPAGFGFPSDYRIEVADDHAFEDARTVLERTDAENPAPDGVTVDADGEARYVRVVASDPYEFDPASPPSSHPKFDPEHIREERRAWQVFALAALVVRDETGADIAAEQPVAASSSVETATWGREKLVDGHEESRTAPGSPLLRTEVDLETDVARASAHVCGLGYGEFYVNGERVGDDALNPDWTQYDERAVYSTYDVTDHLEAGANAVGLWLGRGWFGKNVQNWTGFGAPRGLLQLEIEYGDGTTRTVSTDGSWRAASSPVLENDLYDGERYDAREEYEGWADLGFDDAGWEPATVVDGPGGDLVPQQTPPIRVTETVEPEAVLEHDEGTILDFGRNLVGWVELTVEGASAGDEIELRHAETLLEDGSLALADLRSADATDTYVANGAPVETYEPRFTYHGFRYVQVTGYPGDLEPERVTAKVVHTDLDPIGAFDCSNEELSRVQRNAEWGLRGNAHGVLTDCPQRDERFAWTGDNHIAARALCYNFDADRFYRKWMDDHADVRSEHGYIADTVPYGYGTIPEDRTWGITQVTIPWHLYRHYGDVGVLERHYEGMRQYLEYWHSESDDGLVSGEYGNYGDWLTFENADGRRGLPFDLYNTAFHYHTTNLFAKIAAVLDRTDDAERYAARAESIAATFNEAFFDVDAGRYGPGTQSSYAVPLFVGLVPDEHAEAVAANLAETVRADGGKLRTGFLGTRPLVHALVDFGHEEVAYEVVSQPERPGWVYMSRQGATTMWERWDADDHIGDGMNSFNHSPLNFVSEWFYTALAGLRFDDSMHGRGSVEIAPAIVDDLEWAAGEIETVNGTLASHWERTDDGLVLEAEVPWNTTATVRLPADEDAVVDEGGERLWEGEPADALPNGVSSVRLEDGEFVAEIGAGTYAFERRREN